MVPSARPQHNQPGQVHHNPSSHYGHHQISPESQPIEKEKKRIPRPANSFMTYRTEKQREVLQQHAGVNNKDVSIIIGEMWRNEPESVKEYYRQKAEIGRQDHAIRYPDYKYTP
ncbi:high mobility group box domain-containing protein, partial [Phlyctochytrium arcticum]